MGSSGTCQVAGYWYSAGMHLVFCTGCDELLSIVGGEKTIWEVGEVSGGMVWGPGIYCYNPSNYYDRRAANIDGTCLDGYTPFTSWYMHYKEATQPTVTNNVRLHISKKNLFGGQDRAGGVEGHLDVMFGRNDQGVNDYLVNNLGPDLPAYRGVFSMVLRGMTLSCNNPQIEPWGIRARRTITGWMPEIDRIGDDMNPVHIICDCLFDAEWGGVGLPEAKRGDSFAACAQTLYGEGFGLSFLWAKNESIEDFVNMVLRHIDATIYQDYETGKLEMSLTRDDYGAVGALPLFDTSNIISLEDYDAKSTAELINTVTIKYTDPSNGKDQSITLSDISAIDRADGEVLPMEKDFFGVSSADIASKIAVRELRVATLPLATATFLVNRSAFFARPGSVIRFSWAPLGISNVAMRVTAIDFGTLDDSVIRVDCIVDVFSFGSQVLSEPPTSSNWVDPIGEPINVIDFTPRELTYWQLTRLPTMLLNADTTDGAYLSVAATPPLADYSDFELWENIPGALDYKIRALGGFSETYKTTEELPAEVLSTIVLNTPLDFADVSVGNISVGHLIYIGEELVGLMGISENLDEITVSRGLIDTVPRIHPIGTVIQFVSSAKLANSVQEFAAGEVVNFKMLPANTNGRLYIDAATEHNYTFKGRLGRPYPPGNVTLNGCRYPVEIEADANGECTLAFAHRNRLVQTTSTPESQTAGSIGPEPNTVYNVVVTDADTGSTLYSNLGTTLLTHTLTGLDSISRIKVSIESSRNGQVSHQKQEFITRLIGYGKSYGIAYGGILPCQ